MLFYHVKVKKKKDIIWYRSDTTVIRYDTAIMAKWLAWQTAV